MLAVEIKIIDFSRALLICQRTFTPTVTKWRNEMRTRKTYRKKQVQNERIVFGFLYYSSTAFWKKAMYTCAPASTTANWWTSFDKSEVEKTARAQNTDKKHTKNSSLRLVTGWKSILQIRFKHTLFLESHIFSNTVMFDAAANSTHTPHNSYTIHGSTRVGTRLPIFRI